MTALDLDHLERVAREATNSHPSDTWDRSIRSVPQGGGASETYHIFEAEDYLIYPDKGPGPIAIVASQELASYVAVAHPSILSALIARLRAAEARANNLRNGKDRRIAGLREAVTMLHTRAKGMNDPHAAAVINSAALHIGEHAKLREPSTND